MTKFDYKILWSGVIKEIREEIAEIFYTDYTTWEMNMFL